MLQLLLLWQRRALPRSGALILPLPTAAAAAATAVAMIVADGFDVYQNASTMVPPNLNGANCTTESFYNFTFNASQTSVNVCSLRQYSKEQITAMETTITVCAALSVLGAAFVVVTFAVFKDLRVQSLQLIMCVACVACACVRAAATAATFAAAAAAAAVAAATLTDAAAAAAAAAAACAIACRLLIFIAVFCAFVRDSAG